MAGLLSDKVKQKQSERQGEVRTTPLISGSCLYSSSQELFQEFIHLVL